MPSVIDNCRNEHQKEARIDRNVLFKDNNYQSKKRTKGFIIFINAFIEVKGLVLSRNSVESNWWKRTKRGGKKVQMSIKPLKRITKLKDKLEKSFLETELLLKKVAKYI